MLSETSLLNLLPAREKRSGLRRTTETQAERAWQKRPKPESPILTLFSRKAIQGAAACVSSSSLTTSLASRLAWKAMERFLSLKPGAISCASICGYASGELVRGLLSWVLYEANCLRFYSHRISKSTCFLKTYKRSEKSSHGSAIQLGDLARPHLNQDNCKLREEQKEKPALGAGMPSNLAVENPSRYHCFSQRLSLDSIVCYWLTRAMQSISILRPVRNTA